MSVFLFALNIFCFIFNLYLGLTEDNVICILASGVNLGVAIMLLSDMIGDWDW